MDSPFLFSSGSAFAQPLFFCGAFLFGSVEQSFHIAGVVGGGNFVHSLAILIEERMVDVEKTVESAAHDMLHQRIHIFAAIFQQRLLEIRECSADIAEMDDGDLIRLDELVNILVQITERFTFQPAAYAHLHGQIRAIVSHSEGPAVTVGVPDEAVHTAYRFDGRIIGVERQLHVRFLAHRQGLVKKILEVAPDLILAVFTVVGDGTSLDLIQVTEKRILAVIILTRTDFGAG